MANEFDPIINQAAEKHGVDPEVIRAIIRQESAGNPNAVSRVGAQGLMQLMPGTAKELGVIDSLSPFQNIMAGTKYFKQQLDRFGSIDLALAAYNAGPGAVRKHGGIPPFAETQDYVKRITAKIKGGGITPMANEFNLLEGLIDQPFSDPADLLRGRRRQIGQRRLGTEQAFAEFERPESRFQQIADPIEGILSGLALIADLTSGRKERRRGAPEKFTRLQEGRALRKERRRTGRREELQATLAKQEIGANLQDQLFSAIQSGRQEEIRAVQQKISNQLALGTAKREERRVSLAEKQAGKVKAPTAAEEKAAERKAAWNLYDQVLKDVDGNETEALKELRRLSLPAWSIVSKETGIEVEDPEKAVNDIYQKATDAVLKIYGESYGEAIQRTIDAEGDEKLEALEDLKKLENTMSIMVERTAKIEVGGQGLKPREGTLDELLNPPEDVIPPEDAEASILERFLEMSGFAQSGRAIGKSFGAVGNIFEGLLPEQRQARPRRPVSEPR